ncbi:hypothetical protein [Mucilaginibacter sp. CSA2-8R]|uniref:glycosyl-4,4'-diaponeurosporenoate acyltransferase CrtO family protein n=1 Tax=Mucilaginibacter sp. CSA2-8R TaxID=3141542 RepID=UPI00315DFC21
MKKTLNLILIVVVTAALVYVLVRFTGIYKAGFAIALNFLLMGGALMFTETMQSDMHWGYFDLQPWESGGKVYERLGIHLFRKLLVWVGWEKLGKATKPVGKGAETLANLYYRTKIDELGHLIILVIVSAFTIVVAFRFGLVKALPLLISNILLNLYPVMLQRFNRPRIVRAIQLSQRKLNAQLI